MAKGKRQNSLLVEIIIAVLFFALSATVILDVFVTAYKQSAYADVCDMALTAAQNLSERLYVSEDAQALLQSRGFAQDGDAWLLEENGYTLRVELGSEPAGAGTLATALITALSGEETLVELPSARYISGEVSQ